MKILCRRLLLLLIFSFAQLAPVSSIKQQSRHQATISHHKKSKKAHNKNAHHNHGPTIHYKQNNHARNRQTYSRHNAHKKSSSVGKQGRRAHKNQHTSITQKKQNKKKHTKQKHAHHKKSKSRKLIPQHNLTARLQALQPSARARASAIKNFLTRAPQFIHSIKQLKNKQLSLNFEHLVLLSLATDNHGTMIVSGFHHDHQKKLLHKNFYKLKQIKKMHGGAYRGIISVGGKNYGTKSFFPAWWDDKKIVLSIIESINNPIKKPSWDSMKQCWTLEGRSRDGVTIRSIVSQKAFIVTAFPV